MCLCEFVHLCVYISMQEFECELVHVPALLLSAMIHSVAGVIGERHTPLESEPGW